MEAYRYKAVNAQGRVLQGRIDAVNPADLETRLSRLGLDLVNYRELKRHKHVTGRGIQRVDLITFCFHLEHLVRAGVPILEGLADLRDTIDNKRLREVTGAMIESIEGGKNLSQSMLDFPAVFPAVFVSLIRAGEESGQLNLVLSKIIENLKWQDEQAAITKKLLLYPAIVTVVVINDPKGAAYGGGAVAAPVFSTVTQGVLRLLNVAPTDTAALAAAAAASAAGGPV